MNQAQKLIAATLRFLGRRAVLLPLLSACLLGTMCFQVSVTHADTQTAVLTVRVDELKTTQDEVKATLNSLATSLQEQRDKQNQLQGMIIGFGGFAALLQVLNTVLQFRGDKSSKT